MIQEFRCYSRLKCLRHETNCQNVFGLLGGFLTLNIFLNNRRIFKNVIYLQCPSWRLHGNIKIILRKLIWKIDITLKSDFRRPNLSLAAGEMPLATYRWRYSRLPVGIVHAGRLMYVRQSWIWTSGKVWPYCTLSYTLTGLFLFF